MDILPQNKTNRLRKIKFILFYINCFCFLVFSISSVGTIYVYAENIIEQDIGQFISIIFILLIVFSLLCWFTCGFCIFNTRLLLRDYIIILCVIFVLSVGCVLTSHYQFGKAGILLMLEQVLRTRLAYNYNIINFVQILFYGIPVVIFINLVMACIVFVQLSYTDTNKTQIKQSEGPCDNMYNEIHQNPQNDNPPTNPHYHQQSAARTETAIPILHEDEGDHQQVRTSLSLQDERDHQQVHTSLDLSIQEPPSYHEAVVMNIQSKPQVSGQGHEHPIHQKSPIFPGPPTPWYKTQLPSYNEAAVISVHSTIEESNPMTGASNPVLGECSVQSFDNISLHTTPETSLQRQIRPIQPPLPREAPPPYQLWMLRVSKRLKRPGSKFLSTKLEK